MDAVFFFFQAEDGIRDLTVTGVQTCALPICVQRSSDTSATRFAGDSSAQEIHFRGQSMADIVEHGWRMIRHRTNFVHFPGIFAQLNSSRLGYLFSFFDQAMEQVPQASMLTLIGKMRRVRQSG